MRNYFGVLMLFSCCYADEQYYRTIENPQEGVFQNGLRFFEVKDELTANENTWQYHWQKGFNHFFEYQYQEASFEFDESISLMSEEETNQYPYVMVYRAESNFFLGLCEHLLKVGNKNLSLKDLGKFQQVLQDTEKALKSDKIAENEKDSCKIRREDIFIRLYDLNAIEEEFERYGQEK